MGTTVWHPRYGLIGTCIAFFYGAAACNAEAVEQTSSQFMVGEWETVCGPATNLRQGVRAGPSPRRFISTFFSNESGGLSIRENAHQDGVQDTIVSKVAWDGLRLRISHSFRHQGRLGHNVREFTLVDDMHLTGGVRHVETGSYWPCKMNRLTSLLQEPVPSIQKKPMSGGDDWWKSPEDKVAANTKPVVKPSTVEKSKDDAKSAVLKPATPKPVEPKPMIPLPPAESPKVETPPAPEPVVPPAEPANGKSLAMGAGLLALLSAVFFFIRNAYVNYLVGSLKRSPNDANLAGWALFGGFLFASAMGSIALANSDWLTGPVQGALGGLSAVCFGLCAMTSRKK